MALPTLDKTWQYTRSGGVTSTVNKLLTTTGTILGDQRQALLQIVNDLLNFGTNRFGGQRIEPLKDFTSHPLGLGIWPTVNVLPGLGIVRPADQLESLQKSVSRP